MRVAFIEEILSYLIYKTPIEKNREEARIQLVERNRILSNLSHSIKNMLRSVIDPLINLREEFPQKANVIDNAIKGAHLIREIVNSINLSYETNIEDISWDITHPDAESITLQEMLLNSLKYSIGNMFDFRYFPQYAENYYPRSIPKDDFDSIKAEWNAVSSVHDFEPLVAFAEKHLCKLSVNLSEAAQYTLGNEKSSAIKLMIMFQEIIFNAVKYASFVPRAERFLEIRLDNTETTIRFEVINSYRPEVRAKTTGVGKLVIENFSKVLGTDPEIKKTDSTYSIYIEFNNLWRNNAQDTVH
jgi:two-component sensor histidine kinase